MKQINYSNKQFIILGKEYGYVIPYQDLNFGCIIQLTREDID